MSNEWVLLVLEKKLMATKPLKINQLLKPLETYKKEKLKNFVREINSNGDHIFENNSNPLNEYIDIEPLLLTQMLIALLNMPDHGDHEACTVVALLLKLGRNHHDLVVDECLRALKENKAPSFYLNEVIEKILK